MKILKSLGIATVFLLSVLSVNAQDPYYSQFFMSPLTSNPALAGKGVSDSSYRLLTDFRSQWWGTGIPAFRTNSVSLEKKIAMKNLPEDEFAIALSIDNDASDGGLLKKNYFAFTSAFNKKVSKNSFLGIGLTFSYSNLNFDQSKFLYQSQFGSLGFLRTAPSYDPLLISNKSYLNADAGIHYSYEDDKWGLNLGIAGFHLAKNNQGVFVNGSYSNQVRYSSSASIFRKYNGGDEFYLISKFDNQGLNNVITAGSIYKIKIPGQHPIEKFNVGLFNRFNDSVYPFIGLESSSWFAGFSYDIINSDLKTSYNSVQSMEITFGWQASPKKSKINSKRMVIY